jgi:hypothetical protein
MQPFKAFKVRKEVGGKTVSWWVARAGENGTGQTFRFQCGFCKDKDGKPTAAFRSWRERLAHANLCPNRG